MKPLNLLIKNIRNLLPYIALIALYFFFINIEAKKNKNSKKIIKNENMLTVDETKLDKKMLRIEIPVIPYNQ